MRRTHPARLSPGGHMCHILKSAVRPPAATRGGHETIRQGEVGAMKNCKMCGFSKVCNDLPGICILLQFAAVAVLVGALSYLFISQELLQ